jgi:hypothetical protein
MLASTTLVMPFYSNYTVDTALTSADDYSPSDETSAVTNPSENF